MAENLYSHEYPVNAIGSSYREVKQEGSNLLDRSLSQLYRTKALRLSEIESDEALVKFIPSSDFRKDLDGNSRKLSKIEIYQKNGSQKKLLKSFSFRSSYFPKVTTGGNTVKDLFDNLATRPFTTDGLPLTTLCIIGYVWTVTARRTRMANKWQSTHLAIITDCLVRLPQPLIIGDITMGRKTSTVVTTPFFQNIGMS